MQPSYDSPLRKEKIEFELIRPESDVNPKWFNEGTRDETQIAFIDPTFRDDCLKAKCAFAVNHVQPRTIRIRELGMPMTERDVCDLMHPIELWRLKHLLTAQGMGQDGPLYANGATNLVTVWGRFRIRLIGLAFKRDDEPYGPGWHIAICDLVLVRFPAGTRIVVR